MKYVNSLHLRKLLLFPLLGIIGFITSNFQVKAQDSLSHAIRLNPIRLFEGTFQLEYEHQISPAFSINVAGMGTYATKRALGDPYLQSQTLEFDHKGQSYTYNPQMISGWGINAQLRHYLLKSKDNPVGFYAAPMLMYRKIWLTGREYVYEGGKSTPVDVIQNLDVFAGGVILGGQLGVIKDIFSIDVYVGAKMRLSTYGGEDHFTRYKRWISIDYSGVMPTLGASVGILK